jgi:hypothetical protein
VIHKSYQRLVWIYKKGDFAKFNNLISQFDWYKLLNLIFAYVINIRLFAHFFMKRIANFHFSFNTRIKPQFITVAYCNCFCWDTVSYKLIWSFVKKLMGNVGRSCTMPPLLDTENNILYVDDIDKCNLLNSFFCSISTNFHFSFNTRIKPQFITVAYCNCFCWDTLSYKL